MYNIGCPQSRARFRLLVVGGKVSRKSSESYTEPTLPILNAGLRYQYADPCRRQRYLGKVSNKVQEDGGLLPGRTAPSFSGRQLGARHCALLLVRCMASLCQ